MEECELESSECGSSDTDGAQSSNGVFVDFPLVGMDYEIMSRAFALGHTTVKQRCINCAVDYAFRCREEGVKCWKKIFIYVDECRAADRDWLLLHPDWMGHSVFDTCHLHDCVLKLRV